MEVYCHQQQHLTKTDFFKNKRLPSFIALYIMNKNWDAPDTVFAGYPAGRLSG
jgi:hypothetical protein